MKKIELQKYKFDGKVRYATFLGLIALAVSMQIINSSYVGEVIAAILVLAGVNRHTN